MNISDPSEVIIEEIDSNDVPEAELSQFYETEPLRVLTILDDENIEADEDLVMTYTAPNFNEANLIQKYVHGEAEFPDMYTKLEPYEDDDIEDDDDDDDDMNDEETERQNVLKAPYTCQQNANLQNCTQINSTFPQVNTSLNYNYGSSWRKQKSGRRAKKRHDSEMPSTSASARGTGVTTVKKSILSAALQGLMGEANLSFARGQLEIAEKICLEIIRQNPLAPEPFFTLAEIYESRDTEKFLNFLTIAVHLKPSDRYQWIRIAEMHIAQGNLQRARLYYTRAIKIHQRDYDLRLRKARLLEMMGEKANAMFTYLKMIQFCPPERHDLCLNTAKTVAKHFHGLNKSLLALEAMESAYTVCGRLFSLEDINLYLELLILNKEYNQVLQCLRERTSLELETGEDDDSSMIYFCVIPDNYVPDIRVKLCVTLIALKAHHLLGYLIQNLHEHVPPMETDRLNLYCDIAEALMQEHKYAEAISLLRPITDGDLIECPAFIWLKQAECLRHLNRCCEAIESFTKVVKSAPYCYEAKFTLSALLKQQGRHVEAVKALEQSGEEEGQPLHARLLYERCIMLQQINEIDEFLEIGCVLLGRMSVKMRNREEMLAATNGGSFYNSDGLKTILQMRNIIGAEAEKTLEGSKQATNAANSDDLSVHDEYQLFLELMRTGYVHKNYAILQRTCLAMVNTKRFMPYHIDLERIMILACYFNSDCSIAFSYLREMLHKNATSTPLWNLLGLFVQKGQDLRYHRYISRLLRRRNITKSIRIFTAHYHMHCSSYKYALNIYMPLFKDQPSGILALCIAIIFQQLSMQKKVLRKSAAVSQALVFVNRYGQLRSTAYAKSPIDVNASMKNSVTYQEIMFNIGRIYHQSGMFHLAIEYYERGLQFTHPLLEEHENIVGLKQEIAFNLHLIYRANGNLLKARQYLYEYCVV